MVERRAKETPSVTKPLTSNGDARTVHPTKGVASYEKGYSTEHPFHNQGYKGVGSSAKTGKAEKPCRPGSDKANYENGYTRDQGHTKEGYGSVGKGESKGAERTEGAYKKKSPWRNA